MGWECRLDEIAMGIIFLFAPTRGRPSTVGIADERVDTTRKRETRIAIEKAKGASVVRRASSGDITVGNADTTTRYSFTSKINGSARGGVNPT